VDHAMHRISLLALLLLLAVGSVQAETMYVKDVLYVPVRAGEGNQYRIVHQGLRSGTPLEVIEQNEETGYSFIRFGDGNEGYIQTQYLTGAPIAEDRLARVQSNLEEARNALSTTRSDLEETQTALEQTREEKQQLESRLSNVTEELERIKSVSENAINLEKRNTELREARQELQKEVEVLATENERLKDSRESSYLLTGGGLVLAGIFIAVVFPLLKPSRKSENWA